MNIRKHASSTQTFKFDELWLLLQSDPHRSPDACLGSDIQPNIPACIWVVAPQDSYSEAQSLQRNT